MGWTVVDGGGYPVGNRGATKGEPLNFNCKPPKPQLIQNFSEFLRFFGLSPPI